MKRSHLCLMGLSLLLLTSCMKKEPPPPPKQVNEARKLPYYNRIIMTGDADLRLTQGGRRSALRVKGDSRDVALVKTGVKNNTLYVVVNKDTPQFGKLTVNAHISRLMSLNYRGRGNVFGRNIKGSYVDLKLASQGNVSLSGKLGIHKLWVEGKGKVRIKGLSSRALDIVMRESPEVKIKGITNLEDLNFNGEGKLGLYWINSRDLRVRGNGEAEVHLAGYVRFLHARLKGSSVMDGRYLRVLKAYVHTIDRAEARLQPIAEMNAHAEDMSNIYYYNEPHFKANYMSQNGSILAMYRYW